MADGFDLSELSRRLENLLRIGTVAQADYGAARVRVKSGDLLTGWLPWLTRRASNDVAWWAPEVGEQVLLLCPSGDPALGVALPAVYQAAHPANGNRETVARIDFADGGFFEYDRQSGAMTINVVGDANVTIGGNSVIRTEGHATISAGACMTLNCDVHGTVDF